MMPLYRYKSDSEPLATSDSSHPEHHSYQHHQQQNQQQPHTRQRSLHTTASTASAASAFPTLAFAAHRFTSSRHNPNLATPPYPHRSQDGYQSQLHHDMQQLQLCLVCSLCPVHRCVCDGQGSKTDMSAAIIALTATALRHATMSRKSCCVATSPAALQSLAPMTSRTSAACAVGNEMFALF